MRKTSFQRQCRRWRRRTGCLECISAALLAYPILLLPHHPVSPSARPSFCWSSVPGSHYPISSPVCAIVPVSHSPPPVPLAAVPLPHLPLFPSSIPRYLVPHGPMVPSFCHHVLPSPHRSITVSIGGSLCQWLLRSSPIANRSRSLQSANAGLPSIADADTHGRVWLGGILSSLRPILPSPIIPWPLAPIPNLLFVWPHPLGLRHRPSRFRGHC